MPRSSSGEHHPGNLRCCCARCNSEKGTKTLVEAVRISSCGDINFDDLSLVGTPPTFDELISAWRQWVLPSIDDDVRERGYRDREREERWSAIYFKRIARLESSATLEPEREQAWDNLTLGYIGIAAFLKQYGRSSEAISFLHKRLKVEERLLLAKPAKVRWFNVASCLFDLTKLGEDIRSELERLRESVPAEAHAYIDAAIKHMQLVADRRDAQRTSLSRS
jgi:hypothetical protein